MPLIAEYVGGHLETINDTSRYVSGGRFLRDAGGGFGFQMFSAFSSATCANMIEPRPSRARPRHDVEETYWPTYCRLRRTWTRQLPDSSFVKAALRVHSLRVSCALRVHREIKCGTNGCNFG
jgi:hypothetical protein